MRLYCLRHGQASFNAATDFDRQLTDEGLSSLGAVQRALGRVGFAACFVSPYTRTRQTFECVMGQRQPVISEWLTPDTNVNTAIAQLYIATADLADDANVLLVLHQPLISKLIDALTNEPVPMMPASYAVIDIDVVAKGLGFLNEVVHLEQF